MSVSITAIFLDPRSIYPVLDPRRTAGPGPFSYGYPFAEDAVNIYVAFNPARPRCQMMVKFTSTLDGKEIQAHNLHTNTTVDSVGSADLHVGSTMLINKGPFPSSTGADTVILAETDEWGGRQARYTFESEDFWDFWGGCTVTFDWFSDTQGSGKWGTDTRPPKYPVVRLPDRTLMRDGAGWRVVFGGTDFVADDAYVSSMGFNIDEAEPFTQLPPFPADGTMLREINQAQQYVVYGGAKFAIPDVPTLHILGLDAFPLAVVPAGGTSKLGTRPIDGTLLRELADPHVYLVENGELRWVKSPATMDARCLPWRHVRIVPDHSLGTLGLNFGPPLFVG
jgi:hypothetical protein